MKKKALILLGILIGFYAVFSMIDTSEYKAEKRLWRMRQRFSAVAQDPKAIPAAQFEGLIRDYRKLIARFPESRYVPQMHSEIASVYLLTQKYGEARKVYQEVVDGFPEVDELVSKAMVDIGNTYVFEQKMDQAVEVFHKILEDYGRTEAGFMMPLYIAGLYRNAGQAENMRRYLKRGEAFYKNIAENQAEPDGLRMISYRMLATTHIAQGNFGVALDTVKKMLYEFADSDALTIQSLRMITRMINVTAVTRLQDYDRAIGIYRDFISDHPAHRLNQFLEKVIETLDHLKSNQGQVAFSGE